MAANIQDVANKTFDYVIVGGGTAGLTLAARLSEDPSKSVLVLEAGEAHLSNKDILAVQAYGSHFANSAYAYRHKWITQKHAADREGVWERGKGLGGSSGINFLAWFRPPAKDIDDLGKLGNPGWTFANYLPRVTRVEGLTEPSKEVAERNYIDTKNWTVGRDGPVQVSVPKNVSEGESRIMDTFHKAGFPKNSEPYNGDPTGYFILLTSRDPKTNTRSYAATAYYEPNVHRTNFTVLVTASARRVLLSSIEGRDELKATGVEFEHGGHVHEVYAKNEVILTAGTLSSPHLLELSGIGRRDVLSKIGVPLKVELPGVGENLQEHIYVAFSFKLKEDAPMQTLDILRDPAVLADHIQLEKEGKGLFHEGVIGNGQLSLADTSPRAPELYTRITQILTALQDEVAEMEKNSADKGDVEVKKGLVEQYKLLVQRYHPKHGEGSPSFQWISFPAFFSGPNVPEPGKQYTSPMMVLNHTFSRGTIHSVSNDPSVSPEIDPRYFSQDIDLELMYEQFLRTREVVKLSPFKDMIEGEINPGPNVTSKEDIKDWIKKTFATIYHTVGSCSMLPRDKGGVVSPELKVYGTTNLRVADISIVPLHIGANTQSTAYALGEIAADIINGKWITA